MDYTEEHITFSVEGDTLEGVVAYPDATMPETAILLLAPHPQMGGNMDNNVVRHLARRLASGGALTLRFNYRGVGGSTLTKLDTESMYAYYQRMEEEQRYEVLLPDAIAALGTLKDFASCRRTVYVGYSLGAVLAGMLGRAVRPDAVFAISPPVKKVPLDVFQTGAFPRHFIGGDNDFAFPLDVFEAQYTALPDPKTFQLLQGMDHFFRKEEERVVAAILSLHAPSSQLSIPE